MYRNSPDPTDGVSSLGGGFRGSNGGPGGGRGSECRIMRWGTEGRGGGREKPPTMGQQIFGREGF